MPLAWSARCVTARHYDLQKDQCEFRCRGRDDGLPLATQDGVPFLVLNDIETQSAHEQSPGGDLPGLVAHGVVRVAPAGPDTLAAVATWRRLLDGALGPDEAPQALAPANAPLCNGFVACRGERFHPVPADATPDVAIGATLRDYAALALRAEDPDTLFFARRLRVTGDTELGLVVKNLLDGIDLPALVPRPPWRAR